jgi:hypothetical protein
MIADQQGRLWTVIGEEVRRFDPETQRWYIAATADEVFGPLDEPVEPGRSLTGLALDEAGNVWVGNCTHSGIVITGQGVRWFDGEHWHGPGATEGQCVYNIAVDGAGRVWAGGFDALHIYDPATGAWSAVPLPPWERTQLVDRLTLDWRGTPIVSFTRFSGAGPWHSTAIYRLLAGEWVEVYDPGTDLPFTFFAFGPYGTVWVLAGGPLFRVGDGTAQEIGSAPCFRCTDMVVDGTGRVWIAGETASGPALWWYGSAAE